MAGLADDAARAIYGRLALLAERPLRLHTDEQCAFCGVRPHIERCALCESCEARRVALGCRFPRQTPAAPLPRFNRASNAFSAFTTPEWLPTEDK